jgi:tRNA G18 (ribose-2'-O)-methylase SpoU
MTVVADDVENPSNVKTLLDTAEMFGADLVLREHAHLKRSGYGEALEARQRRVVAPSELRDAFRPILALDNVPNAAPVYGYRLQAGPEPALVVGNERRGVSRELLELSDGFIQIPMPSRRLNCLNVAAAAAVALYYLSRGGIGPSHVRAHPERLRPEVLFLAPANHIELGSSIRSAGAFGWQRVLVEDRHGAWFGSERSLRAEGRAAARRGRNPIRVIPVSSDSRYAFDEVCVVTLDRAGDLLSQRGLAGGPRQLLVVPDPEGIDLSSVDWERFGRRVSFTSLDVPFQPSMRHYRLEASIVLAESARQIGRPAEKPMRGRHTPRYDRMLRLVPPDIGEVVFLEELTGY